MGFELHSGMRQYRRPEAYGYSCVILSAVEYEGIHLLDVHLGSRIDLVEELAYQFTNGLKDYGPQSTTFITSVGRVKNQRIHRYRYRNSVEREEVEQRLVHFFNEQGLDFLDSVNNLQTLDNIYNSKPEVACRYTYNQGNRAIRGMTIARILNRKDFRKLAAEHWKALLRQKQPNNILLNYQKLISLLAYYSVN